MSLFPIIFSVPAVYLIAVAVSAVIRGRIASHYRRSSGEPDPGPFARRDKEPKRFWGLVLAHFATAAGLIFLVVRAILNRA